MSEVRPTVETHAGARLQIVLPGGVPMYFHLIPAGEFRMGQRGGDTDEEPVHRVIIPHAFWMGETPVTQAQFAACKPDHENGFPNHPDHPAERMTWDEAREYCGWLTVQCGAQFSAGEWTADLPDEARWEYACRAGTETEYYSGDGEAALAEVGWYGGNSENETRPVGTKPANAWGLHDMHGNVWEWCLDVWDAHACRKRIDGWRARAWAADDAGEHAEYWTDEGRESPFRVLRGGSWNSTAGHCRSAYRIGGRPSARYWIFGFRVCLARSSPAQESKQVGGGAGAGRRGEEGRRAEPDGAGAAGRTGIDLVRERLPGKPKRRARSRK